MATLFDAKELRKLPAAEGVPDDLYEYPAWVKVTTRAGAEAEIEDRSRAMRFSKRDVAAQIAELEKRLDGLRQKLSVIEEHEAANPVEMTPRVE